MTASETSDRQSKRRRPSKAIVTIQNRTPDPEVSLDVDILILDYVIYQATNALLADANLNKDDADGAVSAAHNLSMTNSFLAIFKAKHPYYLVDDELDFRLLLLKFVTLYVRRLTRDAASPSPEELKGLRARNQQRAISWIGEAERAPTHDYDVTAFDHNLPLPLDDLERNRAEVLNALHAPAEDEAYEDAFYGTGDSLALLDLLPLFMQLSAMRNRISDSTLTPHWMRLAGDFMLQACLEMYCVRGANGSDAIDEAFAWGFKGSDGAADDASEIDDMFESDSIVGEVEGWAAIKQRCLNELVGQPDSDAAQLPAHIADLSAAHPVQALHEQLLHFLGALNQSIPQPVLAQLETGSLEGLTPAQTAEFLEECGLPAGWPNVSV